VSPSLQRGDGNSSCCCDGVRHNPSAFSCIPAYSAQTQPSGIALHFLSPIIAVVSGKPDAFINALINSLTGCVVL